LPDLHLTVRSADPVREQVEATLRRLVDTATIVPCEVIRVARRTMSESFGLARTMLNLTVDGLLGWDVDAGVPRLDSAGAGVPLRAAPAVAPDDPVVGADPPTISSDRSAAADLAISGYEDLAASHIVARLDRLTPSELDAIRTFEVANRGRRTVVGKIDQLLARP
jgi:hypothetical protein